MYIRYKKETYALHAQPWGRCSSPEMRISTEQLLRDFNMPSLLSLFIPNPVNIYISENTFIQFCNHGRESIGLITGINVEREVLTLRHFMSWAELLAYVGNGVLANMSFWPDNTNITPKHLCDTDIAIVLPFEQIEGIAFVFHVTDPIVNMIQGMGYACQVTSQFLSDEMTLFH
jgi:hypothetical protein